LIVGNFEQMMTDVYSAWQLKMGLPVEPPNPRISGFRSFFDLLDATKLDEGRELGPCVAIVETYGYRVPDVLESLRSARANAAEDATVHISTIHQAKGLEFDRVRAGEDIEAMPLFSSRENKDGSIQYALNKAECHLAYVLATRAKTSLNLGGNMERWSIEYSRWIRRPVDAQVPDALKAQALLSRTAQDDQPRLQAAPAMDMG
jgi:hypothetical protein